MTPTYTPREHDDHPPFLYSDYKGTVKRAPSHDLISIVQTLTETTGPGPAWAELSVDDADLTTNAGTGGEAIGQRSIITGRVIDDDGTPVAGTLVEIWQANVCGRYMHWRETAFPAPLDPNFLGVGQCRTNADGEYRFVTIKPGPYPWGNHPNAWRPAHIHFSIMGPSVATRLVTQMYFPDDPLFDLDPIFRSVPADSRDRLIAVYDHSITVENWALGYRWDIVLRGNWSYVMTMTRHGQTPSQTVGPYFTMRLSGEGENVLATPESLGERIRIEGRVLDGNRQHIEDALIELWQADSAGRYHHPGDDRTDAPSDPAFTGFGRCASDFHTGDYFFLTIKPGPVPHPDGGMQAPHISLTIQARGMLDPTFTRIYFDDEAAANAQDPVLQSVPEARRSTLIAALADGGDSSVPTYRFDIRYQGDDETVFFDV